MNISTEPIGGIPRPRDGLQRKFHPGWTCRARRARTGATALAHAIEQEAA